MGLGIIALQNAKDVVNTTQDQQWQDQDQDRQFKPKINLFLPDVERKRNVRHTT